jgi:energy-coupling factor transporter ATP-binding protein EcfA2
MQYQQGGMTRFCVIANRVFLCLKKFKMETKNIISKIKLHLKLLKVAYKKANKAVLYLIENNKPAFDNYYIGAKVLYVNRFNKLPCVAEIRNVNVGALFKLMKTGKYGIVKNIYQYNSFEWHKNELAFEVTVFELEHKMMIYLDCEDATVYYQNENYDKIKEIVDEFKNHKAGSKETDFEINIITVSNRLLELKTIKIDPTTLDIDLYYNDDFKALDATIKERLSNKKDKGIVLLHGLPGTGKTTYLRHLIGNLKKKVMFASPSVASNLMNPEFMDLLIDNPNSVLVIEDAENIIMDRRYSSQSSVSNLLNISDGLLSDCLNVQIICTFNSELSFVDSALLRKGRLIAKYEFGKLDIVKANKLSNHLGSLNEITKPMTLAEITNPDDNHYEPKQLNVIGFRREMVLEN